MQRKGASRPAGSPKTISVRHKLFPGDIGAIVHLHGTLYASECGWDHTFEAYVAGPLAEFTLNPSHRRRLWIVDYRGVQAGSIAIVDRSKSVAQLRWFLLHPSVRGRGLGKWLLWRAIVFARACGYSRIELWTTRNLAAAAHLYGSAGFVLRRELTHQRWGKAVTEQRYELSLKRTLAHSAR